MIKIHFQDQGQDCLTWTIDSNGVVIDCGPFQHSIWVGNKVTNHDKLKVGGYVSFQTKHSKKVLRKIYPIEKIEPINESE